MGVRVREKVKGSKVYWLFINHGGRRKAKCVGDKKAAELAATKIRAKLAEGDLTALRSIPTAAERVATFGELATEWLSKYPALHAIRSSTLHNYSSFTRRHLIPYFGTMRVDAIDAQVIEDFIERKRAPGGSTRFGGKPLADITVRTGLLALRLILARAVRMKMLPGNPMNEVEWRSAPRVENVDPFTTAELRAILATPALDADLVTMLELWIRTGLRAGELTGLQPQDLDLDAGTVLVRRTWTRGRLGPTKTGRERSVSFGHPILEAAGVWRPSAEVIAAMTTKLRGLKRRPLEPTGFLFTQPSGRPWGASSLNYTWRRALVKARVRYRPAEQIRHTVASTLLSRGAPLLYVQAVGGWRSAGVLLKVYARWMDTGLGPSGHVSIEPPQAERGRA
jgi:integrase